MNDRQPVQPPAESLRPIERLIEIMRILRSDRGCPWDREQSLATLRDHLIEETYEVADAMTGDDREAHCEELGDLLLQIVFQSQICAEEGAFTFDDVADAIVTKLIRRHPHVFGDVAADNADDVLKNWEAIKRQEKGDTPRSAVDGVPRSLPALRRAHLLQKRVARVGFDWEDARGALEKLREELGEVEEAIDDKNADAIREEIGDLLFAAVNVSRSYGHNAEEVLERTIEKFSNRFQQLESIVHQEQRSLDTMTLAEMDEVWERVKAGEVGRMKEEG